MPDVTTLDELDVNGTFYGVKVALGEDGDTIVAFTHDRRRAVAAVLAFYRNEGDKVQAIDEPAPKWFRLHTTCGCTDCADEHTCHGGFCDFPGLPPCAEDTYSWVGESVPSGTADAAPALEFEVLL